MRFGIRTDLKRRWTPRGMRPEGSMNIGYEWGYLYVALHPEEGRLQAWFMPDMRQNTFQAFLDDFAASTSEQERLLVMDGAPAHRSKVKLPEKVRIQLLPAYSPELNPVERLFEELRKAISNKVFSCIEEVEQLLVKALKVYWKQPDKLIQLTLYPWIKQEINP